MALRARGTALVGLVLLLPGLVTSCGEETVTPSTDGRPVRLIVHPDGSGQFRTIQAAIDVASEVDTVYLANGTFRGPGNRDLDFAGRRLVVRSLSDHPDSCIIDCEGGPGSPHRGFRFHSNEQPWSKLIAITVRNGYAERGGAISCSGVSAPTIVDCVFRDNRAAAAGGACYLSDNSPATLIGCEFYGNRATIEGGAVFSGDSAPSFSACTFAGNSATDGGAVLIDTTPANQLVRMTSCTFAAETPDAVVCREARVALERSILAFCTPGRAVRCDEDCEIALACCDIFGNAAGDWVGCLAEFLGQGGNFSADPLFCDPSAADLSLDPDSPCRSVAECGRLGAQPVGCR